jgi:GntR family transcriptional regulator
MKIDRAISTPSYVQLANLLKSEILEGKFSPGSRLPTEAELVTRSKLSRITVRKGIEKLENEGWVVRKQGLGTFVRSAINQELTSVQTITEVLVGKGVVPRVKVLRFEPVTPPPNVRQALRLDDDRKLLLIERLFSDGNEPIARLQVFLPLAFREHAKELRSEGVQNETTYTIWENKLGVRIKGATYTLRAAKGDRQDAKYLGLKLGNPVLILDRTTFDMEGRPLDFAMFHYHSERYQFSVALPRITSKT